MLAATEAYRRKAPDNVDEEFADQLSRPGVALADAASTFKAATTAWCDHASSPMFVSERGGVAQDELGELTAEVHRTSAVPLQQLSVDGGLLGT